MSIAPSPESPRSAHAYAGRITLVRLDHGCALLVTVARARPDLLERLTAMGPEFDVRGMPLRGVSVTSGTAQARPLAEVTLPFDAAAPEAIVMRLADAISER